MPELSIITVLRNSSHVFKKFITRIVENAAVDTELIFVDNHSRSDVIDYYKYIIEKIIPMGVNYFPRITYKFIYNDKNWLFSRATNQGLRGATGKYLVILNPDVYVTSGWDVQSIKYLSADTSIGLIGYNLLS
jgi:GT2 family glycosyltransferase